MRCSPKTLVALMLLAAPAGASERHYPDLGKPLAQAEIDGFDHMIGPQGQQLPPGQGTAKEGAAVYARRCAMCHGKNGNDGISRLLVAGSPGKPFAGSFYGSEAKNGISFYPYATIAWDYINRAMPAPNPGSLKPSEVYAVVAFLFYRNGIIKQDDVMDAKTLPKVQMPNRNGFVPAVPVYPAAKTPSWW